MTNINNTSGGWRPVTVAYHNAYLLISLTCLFWAGNFVIGRGISETIPPIALAFIRWTFATFIVLPFAWRYLQRDWQQIKRYWFLLFCLGVLGGGSFNTLTYIGLNHTTATNAIILNSAAPVFIVLANFAFFRETVSLTQMLGILISFLGIMIIIGKGSFEPFKQLTFNHGDLWVFSAMVLWGLYTAFLKLKPDMHWLSFTAVIYAAAAIVNLPFYLWEYLYDRQIILNSQALWAIIYVSIFPSVLAYIFYNRSVELIGGNKTGGMMNLMPIFGTVLAFIFLSEEPQLYHLAGICIILLGIWLIAKRKGNPASPPGKPPE